MGFLSIYWIAAEEEEEKASQVVYHDAKDVRDVRNEVFLPRE